MKSPQCRVCGQMLCEESLSQYVWFGFQMFSYLLLRFCEVSEGPWAFGKCTSVNSSVHVQTTAAAAPLLPLKCSHGRRDSAGHVSKATHCSGLAHGQPAPVTPGYMMFYGHLEAAPIPNLQNSSHSVSLSYMLLLQIIPGSRNRKKCSEIHNK